MKVTSQQLDAVLDLVAEGVVAYGGITARPALRAEIAEVLGLEIKEGLPARLTTVQGCLRPEGDPVEGWPAVVAEAARRYNAVTEALELIAAPITEGYSTRLHEVLSVLREGGR